MARLLFIGDVHVKHVNYDDVLCLEKVLREYSIKHFDRKLDFVVFAGDILDSHEKIDAQLLNAAYSLIKTARDLAPTYVIVGNHDYINNKQFLTENHWMNGMKEWRDVTVVDKPMVIDVCKNYRFLACPYVYPGRFVEALSSTLGPEWFVGVDCVFAHQEFRGCKMGCVISEIGDEWDQSLPLVISGHIHDRQKVGDNIVYPGSSLITSFANNSGSTSGIYEYLFVRQQLGQKEQFIETFVPITDASERKIFRLKLNDSDLEAKLIKIVSSKTQKNRLKLVLSGTVVEITLFKESIALKRIRKHFEKISFKLREKSDDDVEKINDDGVTVDENGEERIERRKRKFIDKVRELVDSDVENSDYVKRDYRIVFCDQMF